MLKYRLFWELYRLWRSIIFEEYNPPFGSVGHAVQSGKITKDEAKSYLDRGDHEPIDSLG